jgi:hypothetical protein
LRPRRGDAPTGARLTRAVKGREEAQNDDRERWENHPDAGQEPVWTEDDASLRPLARALLALAEQLVREDEP